MQPSRSPSQQAEDLIIRKKSLFILFLFLISFTFISAGELKVTQEHPFLINGSWIDASQLKVGDELTLVNGSKVKITKLTDVVSNKSFKVYNLEAGEYHNFVVGEEGVVVHNSNGGGVPNPFNWFVKSTFPPSSKKLKVMRIDGLGRAEGIVNEGYINAVGRSTFGSSVEVIRNPQTSPLYTTEVVYVFDIPQNYLTNPNSGFGSSSSASSYHALSSQADSVRILPKKASASEVLMGYMSSGVPVGRISPKYINVRETIKATLETNRYDMNIWKNTPEARAFFKTIDPKGIYSMLYM